MLQLLIQDITFIHTVSCTRSQRQRVKHEMSYLRPYRGMATAEVELYSRNILYR
jgi:hypothetical protein